MVLVVSIIAFGVLANCAVINDRTAEPASSPAPTTQEVTPAFEPEPRTTFMVESDERLIARGKTLFFEKSCAGCHGENAEGTSIAPSVKGVEEEKIGKSVRGGRGIMPAFPEYQLSREDLKAITLFLISQ